ncbi:hypothetical protein [Paucibacter sp. DJ2R-2]|uniref:hypothetical protein n=1 Tax=Paucibacter sp. DJ2R-2 TaxID=2893558 RepID=UPI0021E4A705|nr:hypothetical protein [Paucibacter sp. DJ2R-2]MCV2423115.1 hypothetical protein [Paucibacter sp. DJ4R-1]MCV2441010.1 hypothetical protein [Paucibacter sp. DJ2R-2]
MRTFLINLWVLVLLLVALVLIPPLVFDGYQLTSRALGLVRDRRAELPNYQGIDWAAQHFREFSGLSSLYQDYIGWRRAPFAGETINIDSEGYRQHPGAPKRQLADIWVFGGSTIWGPGASDAHTIPARLQAHTQRSVFNFGESAYTAHQSYNLLAKSYLLGGRPKHVVFYDGANEVVIKCRTELNFYSTFHEATIRERMRSTRLSAQLIEPIQEILGRGYRSLSASDQQDSGYDCVNNEAKRKLIASSLVMDWMLARHLVESRGGHFVAVLQPIAFTGSPKLDHMPDVLANKALRAQYDAVYPEIKRQLQQAGIAYTDLTMAFDGSDLLYIDFAHVSPRGNDIAAQSIAALLN